MIQLSLHVGQRRVKAETFNTLEVEDFGTHYILYSYIHTHFVLSAIADIWHLIFGIDVSDDRCKITQTRTYIWMTTDSNQAKGFKFMQIRKKNEEE